MAATPFPRLFSPIKLGSLTVKNRIEMCPMGTRLPTAAGFVNDDVIDYYVARARGGAGLITFQYTSVTADGAYSPRTAMLYDDRFIPGLRRLVEQVHAAGAKIAIQLAHVGGVGTYAVTGARPKGPSAIGPIGGETPLELTVDEIRQLIEAFGQAARRAKAAGFDAVQIHGCHGYLIHQFLTPLRNRRGDEWGGDVRRRARFIVEVARRMRELVGPDYPIFARLVVDEGLPGGITIADGQATARMLVESGVDALDITAGAQETGYLSTPPNALPYGVLAPLGEAIKRAVDVPVILVGRIHDPAVAEEILAAGKADMVAMGRQMLADPETALKAEQGRTDEIRPCLACVVPQCHGRIWANLPVGCVVNPQLGREGYYPMMPAAQPKKVLVVGAGPAGLEAATTAARRGHTVTVVEEDDHLGGQLPLAAAPPHKDGLQRLLNYYRRQLELTGVQVRTGVPADLSLVEAERPDVVVVATGGRSLSLPVPGAAEHAVASWDVLAGKAQVGRRVAVIGGGDVGVEVAEYLDERGKEVTIIEMLAQVGANLSSGARALLLKRFHEHGVDYIVKAKVVAIAADHVLVDRGGIQYRVGPLDSVVLAVGTAPRNELVEPLRAAGFDVRPIGDCTRPRSLFEAIREGFEVAYSL